MIRFEKIKRPLTPDSNAQKIMKSCDVISGFYFELKSAIFCSFQLLTSKTSVYFAKQKQSCTPHGITDSQYMNIMIIGADLTEE